MLVADELFFADPADFNDPLDSRPNVEGDLSSRQLEDILNHLIEKRTKAELTTAAKSLRYRGSKTIAHITHHSRKRALSLIDEVRYQASNPNCELEAPLHSLLTQCIEEELLRRYDKGVVSLASRATCPLMWSHYGDQHRGICAGYSVPDDTSADLFKITYGGSRNVKASDIAIMEQDSRARIRVDEAVLFRKARSWSYEREWRLIGKRGVQDSPLELEEVIFGIRCDLSLKYTIVKALENRSQPVRFYEMREQRGTFQLRKRVLDTSELKALFPRRSRISIDALNTLDLEDIGRQNQTE
ncbi:DUF2971 domain-containing protein [Pseudovibrio sp. JE062]|uniref:DUF2971 domain-containing protein n=1 Tax=Pseudovibrio sp. JE062 TaxID=439495 RepID=UPI0012ED6612|nr:DUF2971 domain-containing protein [Pseudovibrio sp. JE062]